MKQSATLKKIASTLNISVSTASRALKNHPDISLLTKQKVKELAEALEYEPNLFAVQLRTNTNKLFGLIIPAVSNYFYDSFIAALEKECSNNGYSIIVLQTPGDNDSIVKNIKTCRQNRVNGIFVCTDSLENLEEVYKLKVQNVPVIFFDKVPDTNEFDKVCLEDEKAAAIAARHIIEKNKKNILALFGSMLFSITTKRLHSFQAKIKNTNVVVQTEINVDSDNAKIITQKFLSANANADCIFCMSDEILIGVMRAVLESGKKYPEEISIIAISNGFFPRLYFPEITYIETNGQELGKLAYKQMIKKLSGENDPEEVFVQSRLIEGGSM